MSIPIGKPIIVYPHECPGCLDWLIVPRVWIAKRMLLFGSGVLPGYAVGIVGG